MMKKMSILFLLITISYPQEGATKVGNSVAQFLKFGVGARASGMAESFNAVSTDVTSMHWNPAGLAYLENNQMFVNHITWLADIDYNYFALGIPIDHSNSLGLFVASVQVPEDEVRTVLQPEGTGEYFDASDMALGFSYARNITDRFAVGFVGKYIQEQIWSMTSKAVAIDVGTYYKSTWKNLRIGIVLNNFGTKMKLGGRANLLMVDPDPTIEGNIESIRAELETKAWEIPLNVQTAVAMDIITTDKINLTLATDMVHPNDNREYVNVGMELNVVNTIYLRSGYRGYGMDEAEGGLAFGGGFAWDAGNNMSLFVDYAVLDWGRLGNVKNLSFVMGF